MRRSPDKMNITLMILSAVAVLMALLLFTDAFVPVFPTGVDRPDSEAGEMGEETKKHWWDKIFGKDETRPEESAEIGETPMDEHPRPDLFREPDYYTEAEMKQWKKPLVDTLYAIAEQGYEWGTDRCCDVGLFDLDTDGTPEVIAVEYGSFVSGIALNAYRYNVFKYHVFDLMEGTYRGSIGGLGGDQYLRLYYGGTDDRMVLFEYVSISPSYVSAVLLTWKHCFHVSLQGKNVVTNALWEETVTSSYQQYRVLGNTVEREEFEAYREQYLTGFVELPETAMILRGWESNTDAGQMAEALLSSGQKFVKG